jgi:hypothetical protein
LSGQIPDPFALFRVFFTGCFFRPFSRFAMGYSVYFTNDPLHIFLAITGAFIVFFGLISHFVKEKLFLSEALVSTTFGIIVGPAVLGWLRLSGGLLEEQAASDSQLNPSYHFLVEFARIAIAIQVMVSQ